MTTKAEMIKIIEAENPDGLRVGSEQDGYVELTANEAEAVIEQWAEGRLRKENEEAAKAEAFTKKQIAKAKLIALGLNIDDLKALGF